MGSRPLLRSHSPSAGSARSLLFQQARVQIHLSTHVMRHVPARRLADVEHVGGLRLPWRAYPDTIDDLALVLLRDLDSEHAPTLLTHTGTAVNRPGPRRAPGSGRPPRRGGGGGPKMIAAASGCRFAFQVQAKQ